MILMELNKSLIKANKKMYDNSAIIKILRKHQTKSFYHPRIKTRLLGVTDTFEKNYKVIKN